MRLNLKATCHSCRTLMLMGLMLVNPWIVGCARSPREHLAQLKREKDQETQQAIFEDQVAADERQDEDVRRTGLFSLGGDSEERTEATEDVAEATAKSTLSGRLFRSLIDRRPKVHEADSNDPFLVQEDADSSVPVSVTQTVPRTSSKQRERLLKALESRSTGSALSSADEKPWWREKLENESADPADDSTPSARAAIAPQVASTTRQTFTADFDSRLEALRNEILPDHSSQQTTREFAMASVDIAPRETPQPPEIVIEPETTTAPSHPLGSIADAASPRDDDVEALMKAAREDLEAWRLASAEQNALDAYQIAVAKGMQFSESEEHPADLLTRIVEEKRRDEATRTPGGLVTQTSAEVGQSALPDVPSVSTAAFKSFPNAFGASGWQAAAAQHDDLTGVDNSHLLRHHFGVSEEAGARGAVNLLPPSFEGFGCTEDSGVTLDERSFLGGCDKGPEVCANRRVDLTSSEREAFLAHVDSLESRPSIGLSSAEGWASARSSAAANRSRVLEQDSTHWAAGERVDASNFDRNRPVRVAAAPPLHSERPVSLDSHDEGPAENQVVKSGWLPSGGWVLLLLVLAVVAMRLTSSRWRPAR